MKQIIRRVLTAVGGLVIFNAGLYAREISFFAIVAIAIVGFLLIVIARDSKEER